MVIVLFRASSFFCCHNSLCLIVISLLEVAYTVKRTFLKIVGCMQLMSRHGGKQSTGPGREQEFMMTWAHGYGVTLKKRHKFH